MTFYNMTFITACENLDKDVLVEVNKYVGNREVDSQNVDEIEKLVKAHAYRQCTTLQHIEGPDGCCPGQT